MQFTCPFCRKEHEFEREAIPPQIRCSCGHALDLGPIKQQLVKEARHKMKIIQRKADRICSLILMSDYPEIDIEIEKAKLRDLVVQLFPQRLDLYRMIYESRFDRLQQQFRPH